MVTVRRYFDAAFLQVLRNSSWSIAATVVTTGSLFLQTVLLARHLGASVFGVYLLVLTYPQAVQAILDFRTREAMTRYLGESLARGEDRQGVAIVKLLWSIELGVILVALGIVVGTAPYVAPHLTDDPIATELMRIYAIAMTFGAVDNTAGAILRVFDRFRLSFVVSGSASLIQLGIVALLVARDSGLRGLVWGQVGAEVAATLIVGTAALYLLIRRLWLSRGAPISTLSGRIREVFLFLLNTNVIALIRAASSKLDVLLVGALGGPAAAGIYKVAMQLGSVPLLLYDPLFVVVYPMFTRWRAIGAAELVKSIARRSSVAMAVLVVPMVVVLAYFSEPLIVTLVGSTFSDAWVPMVIVLVGTLPAVTFFWVAPAFLSAGEASTVTKIVSAGVLTQIGLLAVLVAPFGATGAAISFATMNWTALIVAVPLLRRRGLL